MRWEQVEDGNNKPDPLLIFCKIWWGWSGVGWESCQILRIWFLLKLFPGGSGRWNSIKKVDRKVYPNILVDCRGSDGKKNKHLYWTTEDLEAMWNAAQVLTLLMLVQGPWENRGKWQFITLVELKHVYLQFHGVESGDTVSWLSTRDKCTV